MERRTTFASSFGFTAMLGGALFTLIVLMLTAVLGSNPTAPMAATANALIVVSLLLLVPGVVGVYLAHQDVFGRVETAIVAAHALALLFFPLFTLVEYLLRTVPYAEVVGLVYLALQLVGGIGTGIAIIYRDEFANARLGGSLMVLAVLAVVGLGPLLNALGVSNAVPELVFALFAFGPVGLAWLVVGYDMLTIRDGGVPSYAESAPEAE